jgi:hypothetical protein
MLLRRIPRPKLDMSREKRFSETGNLANPTFREAGRSQWVDATLVQSLLLRAYEADFARGRQFKQNKKPWLGFDGFSPYRSILEGKYCQINWL